MKGELKSKLLLFSNLNTQVFIQKQGKRAPKRMKKRIKEVLVENKDISIQEHKNEELYTKYKNQHNLA